MCWSVVVGGGVFRGVMVTVMVACCDRGVVVFFLRLGKVASGSRSTRAQIRPGRSWTRSARADSQASSRAAAWLAGVPAAARMLASTPVKEIRAGARPDPAAARAMTARMAW